MTNNSDNGGYRTRLTKVESELHELKSNIYNHQLYRFPVATTARGVIWAAIALRIFDHFFGGIFDSIFQFLGL